METTTFYSQKETAQDFHVLNFFRGKTGGYFVDVGAHDGMKMSNTYLLEYKYDWGGVCVEPDPSVFERLTRLRNKSKSKLFCCAVYDGTVSEIEFSRSKSSDGLLSGIAETMGEYKEKVAAEGEKIKVQSRTLSSILDEAGSPSVMDYLSLDTEGSELAILKGFDFAKYKFRFVSVEHNFEQPKRTLIRNLLEKNGYIYVVQMAWDDFYIYPNI